jgi:hypothetical protein
MAAGLQVNLARLLAENFRCRQRLGFTLLCGNAALPAVLFPVLSLHSQNPLSPQGQELLQAMLKVLNLEPEEINLIFGPERFAWGLTLPLLFTRPEQGLFCWHPDLLLLQPGLKKEAYAQLKLVRERLNNRRS